MGEVIEANRNRGGNPKVYLVDILEAKSFLPGSWCICGHASCPDLSAELSPRPLPRRGPRGNPAKPLLLPGTDSRSLKSGIVRPCLLWGYGCYPEGALFVDCSFLLHIGLLSKTIFLKKSYKVELFKHYLSKHWQPYFTKLYAASMFEP